MSLPPTFSQARLILMCGKAYKSDEHGWSQWFGCCEGPRRYWLGMGMFFITSLLGFAQTGKVFISPLGSSVELNLVTESQGDYVLETQASLMEGAQWEPLMQFKQGQADQPTRFVDPVCGTSDQRFFRLRKLLDQGAREVSNFRLLDVKGEAHELYYFWPKRAIVIVLHGDREESLEETNQLLSPLSERYQNDGLLVWHVLARTEQSATLTESKPIHQIDSPILLDLDGIVTRAMASVEVPEAVLVDPRQWSIAYRGPIELRTDLGDQEYVMAPLEDAVESLMSGKQPIIQNLKPFGTPHGVKALEVPSYTGVVAPLLITHCIPCHSEGNIAPWSMDSHARVAEFSGLIKSSVLAGEMPPWHAEPRFSRFSNDKSMSSDEINQLIAWIDAGSPLGEGQDPLPAASKIVVEDWPLGKPDHVVSIPTQRIPAQGSVDYRYFFLESPFAKDVWLRAASVKPGNRSVVHHCLVFKGNFLELLALRGGLGGFFAGYVPGMEQVEFPAGTGKRLRRGDILVFQMHYTTSGQAASDQTQLGLYLSPEPPERELVTSAAYDVDFTIPPHERDVHVRATKVLNRASILYEFSPHMHYRGARSRFTLNFPDGRSETILHVPAYFFDWQALYRLEEPIHVPAGTQLVCEGWFDNTIQNRFNPNPDDTVRFGEQSWEEMFIGYVNYAEE